MKQSDTAEDRLNWYLKACEVEGIKVSPDTEARLREQARKIDEVSE